MPRFKIAIRAAAASRAEIGAAGLTDTQAILRDVYTSRGHGESEPQVHYVLVTAEDAEHAEAIVAEALGWDDPDPANITVHGIE